MSQRTTVFEVKARAQKLLPHVKGIFPDAKLGQVLEIISREEGYKNWISYRKVLSDVQPNWYETPRDKVYDEIFGSAFYSLATFVSREVMGEDDDPIDIMLDEDGNIDAFIYLWPGMDGVRVLSKNKERAEEFKRESQRAFPELDVDVRDISGNDGMETVSALLAVDLMKSIRWQASEAEQDSDYDDDEDTCDGDCDNCDAYHHEEVEDVNPHGRLESLPTVEDCLYGDDADPFCLDGEEVYCEKAQDDVYDAGELFYDLLPVAYLAPVVAQYIDSKRMVEVEDVVGVETSEGKLVLVLSSAAKASGIKPEEFCALRLCEKLDIYTDELDAEVYIRGCTSESGKKPVIFEVPLTDMIYKNGQVSFLGNGEDTESVGGTKGHDGMAPFSTILRFLTFKKDGSLYVIKEVTPEGAIAIARGGKGKKVAKLTNDDVVRMIKDRDFVPLGKGQIEELIRDYGWDPLEDDGPM